MSEEFAGQWFKAPSNIDDTCCDCGQALKSGEIITECRDGQFIHESCFFEKLEDMREAS